MKKISYLSMIACFLCATHFYMNKAAGSIGSNTTMRVSEPSQKTVQVLSGRIGSNIALGDVPAPAQAEPMREAAKNLDAKFQVNAKAFTELSTKIKNKQVADAQKALQQTRDSYSKNLDEYFSKASSLNVTEQAHITKVVLGIEKQDEQISAEMAQVQKQTPVAPQPAAQSKVPQQSKGSMPSQQPVTGFIGSNVVN
jgi:hypothetical protein